MRYFPYIDRLAEAQWFERFGFVAFAGAGCVGIIAGKALGLPSLLVTGGAVAMMLAYALIMWRSTSGRVRADQAGDNLYYMGLLYTLTGLAYAIFTFRPEATSNSIVEGFGIALATTIVGLMLRVFFNQIRADLVEIEDRARLDLAEAASALKAELNGIVREMNDFGRLTRQSLSEAVTGVEAGMVKAIQEAGTGMAGLAATAQSTVNAAFERLDRSSDELIGSTQQAAAAIADHSAATRKLSQVWDRAAAKATVLSDAIERLEGFGSSLAEQAQQARLAQEAAAATSSRLGEQLDGVAALLADVGSAVQANLAALDERQRLIEAAPVASAEQVGRLLREIQERVEAQLVTVADANKLAIDAQVTALRQAVETLSDHNGGLATELEKSRGYVTNVHDSLVTMVDGITREVTDREPSHP